MKKKTIKKVEPLKVCSTYFPCGARVEVTRIFPKEGLLELGFTGHVVDGISSGTYHRVTLLVQDSAFPMIRQLMIRAKAAFKAAGRK